MKPAITRAGWIRIAVILVVGVLLLPFTPGIKQQRNLHLARMHADKLKPIIATDVRFKGVRVGPYKGAGGALMVAGMVNSEEDKAALTKMIIASKPPIQVVYMVFTPSQTIGAQSAHVTPADANTPSFTTKWTPNFKDGTINVEVKNTGKTAFEFLPTAFRLFTPSLTYEHDHDLPPYTLEVTDDLIVPLFTFVGSTLHDNRGVAENGGVDNPIIVQPNETKTIPIPLRMSSAELAKCDYIIVSLFFNRVGIDKFEMQRDDKGVWHEE